MSLKLNGKSNGYFMDFFLKENKVILKKENHSIFGVLSIRVGVIFKKKKNRENFQINLFPHFSRLFDFFISDFPFIEPTNC